MTTFEGRTLDQDTLMEAIRLAPNDGASARWLTHVADSGQLLEIARRLPSTQAIRYHDADARLRRWGSQIGPAIALLPASYVDPAYAVVEGAIGDTFRYALSQRDPAAYVAESKRLADRYLRELPGTVDLTALAHAVQMAGPDDYGTCLVGGSMLDSVFLAASVTGAAGQTSTRRQAAAAASAPSSTSASATSEQSSFADFMNRLKLFDTAETLGEQMMLYFGGVAAAFVFGVAPLLWNQVTPDGGPIADFAKTSAIGAVIGGRDRRTRLHGRRRLVPGSCTGWAYRNAAGAAELRILIDFRSAFRTEHRDAVGGVCVCGVGRWRGGPGTLRVEALGVVQLLDAGLQWGLRREGPSERTGSELVSSPASSGSGMDTASLTSAAMSASVT